MLLCILSHAILPRSQLNSTLSTGYASLWQVTRKVNAVVRKILEIFFYNTIWPNFYFRYLVYFITELWAGNLISSITSLRFQSCKRTIIFVNVFMYTVKLAFVRLAIWHYMRKISAFIVYIFSNVLKHVKPIVCSYFNSFSFYCVQLFKRFEKCQANCCLNILFQSIKTLTKYDCVRLHDRESCLIWDLISNQR